MCDYSLENRASRPAAVGERLIVTNFGGTTGLSSVDNQGATYNDMVAVCLLPGTELAFDAPVKVNAHYVHILNEMGCAVDTSFVGNQTIEHRVARFTKINKQHQFQHHDGLEFPDRLGVEPVLLTHLEVGQIATVLQLPADIEAAKAADAATRAPAPETV